MTISSSSGAPEPGGAASERSASVWAEPERSIVNADGKQNDPDNVDLRQVALREIERREARKRHLPAEFFTDAGWLILLELFVRGEAPGGLAVTGNAERWGISEALAARMIAALIACDLARWVVDQPRTSERCVQLTPNGFDRLRAVLALHQ